MSGPRRFAARLLAATVLVLVGTGPSRAASGTAMQPDWLHLDLVRPEASAVPESALVLDEDRRADYLESGYGTADLLRRWELDWTKQGTLVQRTTTVKRFLTDEGVRGAGNLTARVRTELQDLYVEEAWIALPDGRRRSVDPGSIQLVHDSSADVFSDVLLVVVPLEGLVPGSTAVFVTRKVEDLRGWPLPSAEILFTQGWAPVERFEVEARWEDGLAPRTLRTDAGFLACEAGERSWTCEADRVPAVSSGNDNTIWMDVLPQIVVGEPHTWADLAEAGRALVARSLAGAASLRGAVRRITDGAGSQRETLERIHRFVADEIRYVGMEHGAAAVAPTAVERTIELRYGDCKGKVALFLGMAAHAGIRAWPVLVATDRNRLDKLLLPSWRYFDHMIACAGIEGEDAPVCLDLTSPDAGTGLLPPGLYGSVALDLREGVASPRTIPLPPFVWDIDISAENRLACDGDLTETLERAFRGAGSAWQRSSLRGMTAEDLRRWGVDDYRVVYGSEAEPEVAFDGLKNPGAPLVVRTEMEFEGVLNTDTEDYREPDSWLGVYARWFATANEHHPWWIPGVRIRSRMSYRLCPGTRVPFVGAALDFESEFGKLRRRYDRKPASVEVETSLELPGQTIAAEDLQRYRRFLNAVLSQTQVWFRVENPVRESEAP